MDDAILDLYNKGMINSQEAVNYAQDMPYVEKRIQNMYA